MLRLVGPLIVCSLALASTPAIAQAGATPPPASGEEAVNNQHPRQVLPAGFAHAGAGGSREWTTVRFFCPRHMARKSLQRARGQPQGCSRYCAIHADNRRLARARQSIRRERGVEGVGKLFARSTNPLWQSWACGCGLQRWSATGSRLALWRTAAYPRKPVTTSRLSLAIRLRNGQAGQPAQT